MGTDISIKELEQAVTDAQVRYSDAQREREAVQSKIRPALREEQQALHALRQAREALEQARYVKEPLEVFTLREREPEPTKAVVWNGPEDNERLRGWLKSEGLDNWRISERGGHTRVFNEYRDGYHTIRPGYYIVVGMPEGEDPLGVYPSREAVERAYIFEGEKS